MLEDVGLFEAGFFSYLEDADLAWRGRLRGWKSVVAPKALARHVYSATAGQGSPLKQRLLARNRIRTLVRCVPGPILLRHLPEILAYDTLAAGYGLATKRSAITAGRLEALAELPQLLEARHAIQARRTARMREVARWIEPAPPPWRAAEEQRQLDALLGEREVV
jgi:GT2 family glycosyltransferase